MSAKAKMVVSIVVIALVAGFFLIRMTGSKEPTITVKQTMHCSACDASYEIPDDFLLDLKQEDMKIGPGGGRIFRCRECGELAATAEMKDFIDGVEISRD